MDGPQEGVCGVCGSLLGPPLVACPSCDTQHHQECWSYNGGCAVYACGVVATEPVPVAPTVPAVAPEDVPDWRQAVPTMTLVGTFGLLWLASVPPLLGMALGSVAIYLYMRHQLDPGLPPDALPLPPDDSEALALEQKAVLAHLGRDNPEALAQAYALFEARRPRETVPKGAQIELGLELARAGYPVLAAEALEKALASAPVPRRIELMEAYRGLFAPDLAYQELARHGPLSLRRELPATESLPPGHPGVEALCRDRPQFLLVLSTAGFPLEWQRSYRLPGEAEDQAPQRTRWVAGPFTPEERDARLAELSGLGRLALPVDPEELVLPWRFATILTLSPTSKGCRLVTEEADESFGWDEMRRILFARINRVETRQVLSAKVDVGPRGGVHTTWYHEARKDAKSDSLLEIHVGDPVRRFRVAVAQPHLFAYLGRRLELAFTTNLRLATKDMVRFAPGARASHGVHAMYGERIAPGLDFETVREFEEYALWFSALESPRLAAWWRG